MNIKKSTPTYTIREKDDFIKALLRARPSRDEYFARIAAFYGCSSAAEYEQLLRQFDILYCVASDKKMFKLACEMDAALEHPLDIVRQNYYWFTRRVNGEITEDIPLLNGTTRCFDNYWRLWNRFTPEQQKIINSLYNVHRGAR